MASGKKKSLLDLDDDDVSLEINKDYAQKYSTWREKEELQKLKTKYGEEIGDDSDSSSEEEEDEDAEALTGDIDKNWFRALAAVRSNDPRIYQKDVKFFESEDEEEGGDSDTSKEKKNKNKKEDDKPMYMKEFERKLITEKGGILSESDDDDDDEEETEKKPQAPGYYEEQEAIKKSIKSAMADVSSEDENEDILIKRFKTRQEKEDEEEEFIQFLKGEKRKEELRKDKDIAVELAPLKEIYSGPDVAEDDRQLWNIVLGKGFRSKTKAKDMDWYADQMAQLHADEDAAEQQDEFEHKYNFRFEEPDKDFVKTYARNQEDSVRQRDNKRALKRQEIKERKRTEKENKLEEIRKLKNMKRKEILSKLDQLKEVTGNPDVAFSAKDIEEEFDPAAHDKMMQQYFGDEFYEGDEHEKPQFDDDDDDDYGDDEDWDAWEGPSSSQGKGSGEGHAGYSGAGTSYDVEADYDDSNFNMDADYDPEQASYTSGKKKKKSKFRQVIEKEKPLFEEVCKKYEGSDHPFGDYLDEYFKLDCEDIIAGDVRCRFRYRKTVPNDYGLTVEEILKCPEKELNAWTSLKKITQFRNEEDEMYEVRKYKKAKMLRKKLNILPSLKEPIDPLEEETEDFQQSKKKGKIYERDEDEDEEFSFEEMKIEQSPERRLNVSDSPSEQSPKKKKKKHKAELSEDSSFNQPETEHPRKEEKGSKNNPDLDLSDSTTKKSKKRKADTEFEKSDSSPSKKKVKRVSETKKSDHSPPERKVKKDSKKLTSAGSGQSNGGVKKKKNKNKARGEKNLPSHVMKKKGKKLKNSDGMPKKKGYQAGEMISDSRLVALGIDPRKFKYTKHRIMQEPGQE